ncbi:MAG TPA: S4 domain-containing protein [Steroidobacteraceae bacterium]
MSERLHKLLAQHGFGSRREIEKWMLAGRVLLNDRPAQPGDRYVDGDRVIVDGRDVTSRLRIDIRPKVLIYHKPPGQPVEARIETGEVGGHLETETVLERLPRVRGARWLAINAMQRGDSGLLLATTDGRLCDALRRRSESIPTSYAVRVLVPDPDFDVESIPRVVHYDEQVIEFDRIEDLGGSGANRWFRVDSPRAHRRAAVRALFEARGLGVSRVMQVRFGPLELPRDLPRGRHRELSAEELEKLYALAGLKAPRSDHEHRPGHSQVAARHQPRRLIGTRRSGR